jgi:hypothetical protein
METSARLRERSNLTHTPSQWCFALLLVASLLGCGGAVGSAPSQPPPSNISVTVAPGAAALLLGESQTFTATVSNTTNTGVTWSVNGVPGGNAATGTVGAGGIYVAPQILTPPAQVSLVATSAADPSKSGRAAITLASSFTISISGPSSVNAGAGVKYTATLSPAPNSDPSRVILWSVRGSGCSGAACGTISDSGDYLAPSIASTPAVVQIIATPEADRSKPASLNVSILPVISVTVSPSSATVALGGTQAFQATVAGAQDTTVTWDVNGVVGGNSTLGIIQNSQTDPDHTTYTAPQSPPGDGSVTVHARSNANPAAFASAAISFTGAISITLTPSSATLAIAHRQTFTVRVNNSPDQGVTWEVGQLPGGNSAFGQICAAGSDPCQPVSASNGLSVDYLAPVAVPSPNPVMITATSRADNARTASARVTVLPHIVVSVVPASVSIAGTGQQRFTASVTGTGNQQVIWSITGPACAVKPHLSRRRDSPDAARGISRASRRCGRARRGENQMSVPCREQLRAVISAAVAFLFFLQITAATARAYTLGTIVADMRQPASLSGGTSCPQLTRFDISTPCSINRQWSTSLGTSPVAILTSDQTPDGQLNEIEGVIQTSLSAWTGVSGTLLTRSTLSPLQRTDTAAACDSSDGVNSICFNQNDPGFTFGVLAFTRVVSADAVGQQLPSGTPPSTFVGQILDADILLSPGDPNLTFATPAALPSNPNAYDLESILTHELGHTFGFNHSGVWGAMMFPFAPSPGQFTGVRPTTGSPDAALSDDDRAGLRTLYPDPSDSVHIGVISGRVLPANLLTLPISPAGVTGIFPVQVVALDNATGTVAAAAIAGWSCGDPGPPQFDGTFSLQHLKVGSEQAYAIYAEPLDGPVALTDVIPNSTSLCRNEGTDPGWPPQYACVAPPPAAPFSARFRPGP